MTVYKSFNQALFPYAYGLGLSNNAVTPNSKLDVAIGSVLDSSKTFQINLDTPLTIDATVVGANGIDTGALAASKMYKVFLILGTSSGKTAAGLVSLLDAPYLPYGYDSYALIGYVATDGASHFLKGFWTDDKSPLRTFMYDAPQSVLAGGAAAAYTDVDLSAFVPAVQNTPVILQPVFSAAAKGDTAKLQPHGATGDAVTIIGQVAGDIAAQDMVIARLNTGLPEVAYKVSAGTLAMSVCGYQYAI